jgi:hypothetical protein
VPFASERLTAPLALGVIAFCMIALVVVSSWWRTRVSYAAWRALHALAFGAFLLVLVHSVASGTDRGAVAARWLYVISGLVRGDCGRVPPPARARALCPDAIARATTVDLAAAPGIGDEPRLRSASTNLITIRTGCFAPSTSGQRFGRSERAPITRHRSDGTFALLLRDLGHDVGRSPRA